jgi:hypothetical protein
VIMVGDFLMRTPSIVNVSPRVPILDYLPLVLMIASVTFFGASE